MYIDGAAQGGGESSGAVPADVERTAFALGGRGRMTTDPTFSVVSLFTGAGGLDIGLEQAGLRTVSAVEFDEDCVSTLRRNQEAARPIPGRPGRTYLADAAIVGRPIEDVGPEELRPAGAGRGWTPDVMAGGPPCQPFSSSGDMLSLADPRGRLFEHFVRLASALRPRAILFENVRGLVTARGPKGEPGEALLLVKESFERIGYATNFALLNAADYGCPQRRVRCFMLATRRSPLPQFPKPTHGESAQPSLFGEPKPWVTLGDFLASRPEPDAGDIVRPTEKLAAQLAGMPEGTGLRSAGAREATRPGGHWGYRQGTFVASKALPARTVTGSASQDWVRSADGSLRRLTWRECAALQGFPPEWAFVGNRASVFLQIGNAVPVVFGAALGRALAESLAAPTPRQGPASAPLPGEFTAAINYTAKENRRNGASRAEAIRLLQAGGDLTQIKGLGSADCLGR
jgi:DNA (cytosine-5)-methyltransferase 1